MSRIRGRDTGPAVALRRALHSLDLRFRLHVAVLPGKPDLVFPRWGAIVFMCGCFWHAHHGCKIAKIPFLTDLVRMDLRPVVASTYSLLGSAQSSARVVLGATLGWGVFEEIWRSGLLCLVASRLDPRHSGSKDGSQPEICTRRAFEIALGAKR
jgi:hypothetical protein